MTVGAWRSVTTLPQGRPVTIRTVEGVVCRGQHERRWRDMALSLRWGADGHWEQDRVVCFRLDDMGDDIAGTVMAVAWREGAPCDLEMKDRSHTQ